LFLLSYFEAAVVTLIPLCPYYHGKPHVNITCPRFNAFC